MGGTVKRGLSDQVLTDKTFARVSCCYVTYKHAAACLRALKCFFYIKEQMFYAVDCRFQCLAPNVGLQYLNPSHTNWAQKRYEIMEGTYLLNPLQGYHAVMSCTNM